MDSCDRRTFGVKRRNFLQKSKKKGMNYEKCKRRTNQLTDWRDELCVQGGEDLGEVNGVVERAKAERKKRRSVS